jgi:DHA1 family multidrug resistance protein-like MFS transporter
VNQLVLLRTLQGGITGTVPAASAMVASSVPSRRVGYAMGMLQAAVWVGSAAGPLVGGALAAAIGYRSGFRVAALLLLCAGVGVTALVRTGEAKVRSSRVQRVLLKDWRDVVSTWQVRKGLALRFFVRARSSLTTPFLPLFIAGLTTLQMPVAAATGAFSAVTAAFGAIGSGILGRLADRQGHRRVLMICSVAGGLSYGAMSVARTVGQLLVLSAILGIAVGGIMSSMTGLMARTSSRSDMGALYGLDSSLGSAGRITIPLLGGSFGSLVWLPGHMVAHSDQLSCRCRFGHEEVRALVLCLDSLTVCSAVPTRR